MNWCHNRMCVTGKRGDIGTFFEMLRGAKWEEFKGRNMVREIDDASRDLPNYKPDEAADVNIYFDTACNPQMDFFTKAAAKFPQLHFELYFMEPLCNFAGCAVFNGGELVKQEVGPCRVDFVRDAEEA